MKKIYLVSAGAAAVIILFIAPWLWIDNGENILERDFRPASMKRFSRARKIPVHATVRAST